MYDDRALDKVLHERGVEGLELFTTNKKKSVSGKDLREVLGNLGKYHHARRYPLLRLIPNGVIFHLLDKGIESSVLNHKKTAEPLVKELGKQFSDFTFTLESHPEQEQVAILIQPVTGKSTVKKSQKEEDAAAISAEPEVSRLTVETLDSLEYERLGELYPNVQEYLPELSKNGLTLVVDKDEMQIHGIGELKTFVEERGKKGISLQRFKGLGEMMPGQLWETTMNPETRTLLQVEIQEAAVADKLFDILMGDRVEPRRQFIETHASSVKNLDI